MKTTTNKTKSSNKTKKLTKTGKAYGFLKDEIIIVPNCFE
jgi:hypothetical protein